MWSARDETRRGSATYFTGHLDFARDPEGIDGLLVGKQFAEEWKLAPGDYVTLTSPQGRLTPFGLMPRTRAIPRHGRIRFWILRLRRELVLHALAAAQIFGRDRRRCERAGIPVGEAGTRRRKLPACSSRKRARVSPPRTWVEENRALFRALRLEKLVTAIFIGLITFVAGLNILVVLSMTVTDKAKDIAVLYVLGARREQMRRIFLLLGMSIGATGTLCGWLSATLSPGSPERII